MKKGFLLSLDAIAAITLLITVSLFLAGMSFTYSEAELRYQRYYYAGKDLASVLEDTRIGDVSDFVNFSDYSLDQDDVNRTILDVIGSFWAEGNLSYAENLTKDILDIVLNETGLSYQVVFDGDSIYASENESADFLARLSTVVSGYEKTKPVNGYLARVYLTKVSKSTSTFVYFGGYVGDGNITRILNLPIDANVTDVYMEMNVGTNFTLYINNNSTGNYQKTASNFSADNWTVCSDIVNPSYCDYFTGGDNTIEMNFTGASTYIGGGYLKVTYRTSELTEGEYMYEGNTSEGKYRFPGIKGIINLYSSFYVPGTLQNISVYLHYFNNLSLNEIGIPVYFVVGDKEIYNSNQTGEQMVTIPDYNISQDFGGKTNLIDALSNSTIPIRFGTETFAFTSGEGASDSVLITDVSGSMNTCDVDSPAGPCDCADPAPCYRDRISVAIEVDNDFVDTILGYNGSRVGLVSYTTDNDEVHPISNDSASLKAQINGYTDRSYTCISCGIDAAIGMLENSRMVETFISSKSNWLYNTSYPASTPPDINGTDWKKWNYTDSGWNSGQAILGFENSPYSPGIDTDIGNNGGDYYFRKKFNVTDPNGLEFVELYVLSDDNAEIYLNGYLIDDDTVEHDAKYWNRGDEEIFFDDFEGYYASGNNRIYSDEINQSPGYWIADGTPSDDKEIFLMADYSGYPAHNGTDVLVFRDMDSYGYAETYLNLSGENNLQLFYWWRTGTNNFDYGDYGDFNIWDGEWHDVRTYDYDNTQYAREKIILSRYNMVENFTIKFGSRSGRDEERYYVDDVRIREVIYVNTSYFREGENVIAVKLKNNDADNAKFDLELNATMKRYESILVMSDGFANRCVAGTYCPNNAYAAEQARNLTCEAREEYGIEVYVVAFGGGADIGNLTLMACWNCSADDWIPSCDRFYNSSSADELKKIYKDIAKDIANASFQAQVLNITGNISLDNMLYPDSFISFNYTPVARTLQYGEITLSFESPRLRDSTGDIMITDNQTGTKEGWFIIPSDSEVATKVLDSKITSYSSFYWTDRLWVNSSNTPNQNWTRVYWLGNYSSDYETMGDPYIIQIPSNYMTPGGNNSFKIGTGLLDVLSEGKGGSPDDRVIYTLGITGITLTKYSEILSKAEGSRPTIYYDSNGDNIPESSVTVDVGDNPGDVFDPQNDSVDNAFMQLLDSMNFINDTNPNIADLNHSGSGPTGSGDGSQNNPIDLEITEEVQFNSDFISQIPSMWGPAIMEVRIWG